MGVQLHTRQMKAINPEPVSGGAFSGAGETPTSALENPPTLADRFLKGTGAARTKRTSRLTRGRRRGAALTRKRSARG
jgi:hypothetical protein